MSSLPTAYASQRFGRKSLDFYAAAGDVIGADPRARSDERRLQDLDGARHTVRLMESGFQLDPGDQASVLRMQPGPARRSRPVAVVNHNTGAWSRAHPGAAGLLAKAGVARTWNWVLTILLFALAALAVVWPYLRAFLVEIAPSTFAAAPGFDVFATASAAAPSLAAWRIADVIAPVAAPLVEAAPFLAGFETTIAFAAAALVGAGIVYALRSWRLIWAPLLVGAIGAGAFGFDGAASASTAALAGLGVATGVFLIGGLVNRVRDGARLERRIAVLADHILRNAPEELVSEASHDSVADGDVQPMAASEGDAGDSTRHAPLAAAYRDTQDSDGAEVIEQSGAESAGEGDAAPESASEAEPDAQAGASEIAQDTAAGEADGAGAAEALDAEAGTETPTGHTPPDEPAAEDKPRTQAQEDEATSGTETDADAATAASQEAHSDAEAADTPPTFEQEENERLRTDPRYAARAIVLPPPPPMPSAQSDVQSQAESGEDEAAPASSDSTDADPSGSTTRTLRPDGPLAPNVVPMFAAPAPSRRNEEPVD